jgi:hypothetical protein
MLLQSVLPFSKCAYFMHERDKNLKNSDYERGKMYTRTPYIVEASKAILII